MSGRPLRLIPNDWVKSWEAQPEKVREMCAQGVVPLEHELKNIGEDDDAKRIGLLTAINSLAGQAVGGIHSVESAAKIIDDMMAEAVSMLRNNAAMVVSKL